MNRKNRIETILKNELINCDFKVVDNSKEHIGHNNFNGKQESHFCLIIKRNQKLKDTRIIIHRKINKILKYEFENGLHSLEIKIIN